MMDRERWKEVECIVDQALDLPADKRLIYINEACAGDSKLKIMVEELLHSIDESEGFLEEPHGYHHQFLDELTEEHSFGNGSANNRVIGNYRIDKLIDRGGMGAVYKAHRDTNDFDQTVAVKIMHRWMVTDENTQRFHREQSILARLEHPNIARLYDGGITSEGLPYLIMEYIEGMAINEYCKKNQLTVSQKIKLLKKVCEAVNHAHQALIIHKDLKPTNIFVTPEGEVKILDFGIAQLLHPGDSPEIFKTESPNRLLSLAYASPEQIKGDFCTTATDIYALGVLFYELLSGEHPFDFEGKSISEINDMILHQPPPRLSDNTSELPIAIDDDVGAIIQKMLRKEVSYRYKTTGEVVDELNRYQQQLPVKAREGKWWYIGSKFFKRHKTGLASTVSIVIMIVALVAFYTSQLAKEKNLAEMEATKAREVQDFLIDIFRTNNPDAHQFEGNKLPAVALLDNGLDIIDGLSGQIEAKIDILFSMFEAYSGLDEFEKAELVIDRIEKLVTHHFEADHLMHGKLNSAKADLNQYIGNLDSALTQIETALEIYKDSQGTISINYGDAQSKKALILARVGKYDEALRHYQLADSIYSALYLQGYDGIRAINNKSNMAEVLEKKGEYKKAADMHRQTIQNYRAVYNEPHLNIATSFQKLGIVRRQLGDYDSSIQAINKALAVYDSLLGPNSLNASNSYNELGIVYFELSNIDSAIYYSNRSYEIKKDKLGAHHGKTLATLNTIALIHKRSDNMDQAKRMYEEIIHQKRTASVVNKPSLAVTLYNLADLLKDTGDLERSHTLFQEVVTIDTTHYGPNHPTVAVDLNKLGAVQRELGLLQKADESFASAQKIFDAKYPENHYRMGDFNVERGALEIRKANYPAAAEHLHKALKIYQTNNFGSDNPRFVRTEELIKKLPENLQNTE